MGNLPKRHPTRGVQTPKKPGKTGLAAAKIGWEIGKLSGRENRRSMLRRMHSLWWLRDTFAICGEMPSARAAIGWGA